MFANNHPFHENFFYHRPCPRGKLPSICTDINFSLLKYHKYQSFHALCFLCFWKASHSIRRQSSLYRRTESISRDYLVNRRRQSGYIKAVVRGRSCFPEFLPLRRRQKPFPRSNEFNDFVQSTRDLSAKRRGNPGFPVPNTTDINNFPRPRTTKPNIPFDRSLYICRFHGSLEIS